MNFKKINLAFIELLDCVIRYNVFQSTLETKESIIIKKS